MVGLWWVGHDASWMSTWVETLVQTQDCFPGLGMLWYYPG